VKYKVYEGLSANGLLSRLGKKYRVLCDPESLAGSCSLIEFKQQRESVVLSSVVESALGKLGQEDECLVVSGGCFTLDSLDLLRRSGAVILSLSDFPWTDQSYIEISQRQF